MQKEINYYSSLLMDRVDDMRMVTGRVVREMSIFHEIYLFHTSYQN